MTTLEKRKPCCPGENHEEYADEELEEAKKCYDALIDGGVDIHQLTSHFWSMGNDDRHKEALDILFKKPTPPSNGKEVLCVINPDDPCDIEKCPTCADDPSECPNKFWGIDFVGLYKLACATASLAAAPDFSMEMGGANAVPVVWDPDKEWEWTGAPDKHPNYDKFEESVKVAIAKCEDVDLPPVVGGFCFGEAAGADTDTTIEIESIEFVGPVTDPEGQPPGDYNCFLVTEASTNGGVVTTATHNFYVPITIDTDTSVEVSDFIVTCVTDPATGAKTITITLTETGTGPNGTPVHEQVIVIPGPNQILVNDGAYGNGAPYNGEILLHEANVQGEDDWDPAWGDIAEAVCVTKRAADGKLVVPAAGPVDETCEFGFADVDHTVPEFELVKDSAPAEKVNPTQTLIETTVDSGGTPNSPATVATDVVSHDITSNGAYDYAATNVGDPSDFAGPFTFSFPTVAGQMYVLHAGWGDTQDQNPGWPKAAGATATSSTTLKELCRHDSWTGLNSGNSTAATLVVAIDGTGNTETITLDLGYTQGDTVRGMVVASVTCYTDVQCADLGTPSGLLGQPVTSSSGTAIPTDPYTSPADSSCGIWFGTARHAISVAGDNAGANYSAATVSGTGVVANEAYDFMTGNGVDQVCAIGQTSGLYVDATPGVDTVSIASTQNAGPANQLDMGGYCIVPIIDPIPAGGGTATATVEILPTTLANPCEEDQPATCTVTADIAITTGGADVVTVTPVINGSNGASTTGGSISETSTMTIPAMGSADCTLSFEIECQGGDTIDPATAVAITNVNVSIA